MNEQDENYRRQYLHRIASELFPPVDRFDPSAEEQEQRMADYAGLSVEEFRATQKNLRRAAREDSSSNMWLTVGSEPSREEVVEHFLSFRPAPPADPADELEAKMSAVLEGGNEAEWPTPIYKVFPIDEQPSAEADGWELIEVIERRDGRTVASMKRVEH